MMPPGQAVAWDYEFLKKDPFTRRCLETAVSGYPLAKGHFNIADLAVSAFRALAADCRFFQKAEAQNLAATTRPYEEAMSRAGTEFWMVRNDSRLNFPSDIWPYPISRLLSNAARKMGSARLYVSNADGLIYLDGDYRND